MGSGSKSRRRLSNNVVTTRDGGLMRVKQEPEEDDLDLETALGISEAQLAEDRRWRESKQHLTPVEYKKWHVAAFDVKLQWDAYGNFIEAELDSEDDMLVANHNALYEPKFKALQKLKRKLNDTFDNPGSWATTTFFSEKKMFPETDDSGVEGKKETRTSKVPIKGKSRGTGDGRVRKRGGTNLARYKVGKGTSAQRTGKSARVRSLSEVEAEENSSDDADYASDPADIGLEDSEDEMSGLEDTAQEARTPSNYRFNAAVTAPGSNSLRLILEQAGEVPSAI